MNLQHSVKVSYDDGVYVLDGCLLSDNAVMAFTTSSQKVRCYDARTTTHLFELVGHNAPITDVVTCAAQPQLLFTSQDNTGVMISDMREGRPVHFLSELIGSGKKSSSLSVSDDGNVLALATDGEVQLVDTRTWSSIRAIEELHTDEITRIRFCGSRVLCTAGEDQMVNFVDTQELDEDEMMMNIFNCGEVVTRMSYFAPALLSTETLNGFSSGCPDGKPFGPGGLVTLVGSCENCWIAPLTEGVMETKVLRPNFETYQVDFVAWQGSLGHVTGSKDDEGNAGPLQFALHPASTAVAELAGAHREVARVAFSAGHSSLITGGEDGTIAYWRPRGSDGDEGEQSSTSSMKQRTSLARHQTSGATSAAGQQQQPFKIAAPNRRSGKPY